MKSRLAIFKDANFLLVLGFVANIILFVRSYLRDPPAKSDHSISSTWWGWNDQGHYIKDALAWSVGNLNPSLHYYFPGYGLLAAPFVHITPYNPFCIPDFVSFVATIMLLARWSTLLLPQRRWAPVATVWLLFFAWVLKSKALIVWLDPWDTTPVVPLELFCLLLVIRFMGEPSRVRGFLIGLVVALGGAFRPTDAALYGGFSALFCFYALFGVELKNAINVVLSAFCGLIVGAMPLALGYFLPQGFHQSAYLLLSRGIGFDWRLLPERWVSIMLNSQPWLSGGPGLIENFPWIATGIAGILASVYAARTKVEFTPSLLLGLVSISQLIMYLCYRDLHPTGLFAYGNQHYFKGFVAVSVLFSIILIDLCFRTKVDRVVALFAIIFVAALLPWRLTFVTSKQSQVVANDSGYEILGGFKNIESGFWFNKCGVYPAGSYPMIDLRIGNANYRPTYDFKR